MAKQSQQAVLLLLAVPLHCLHIYIDDFGGVSIFFDILIDT